MAGQPKFLLGLGRQVLRSLAQDGQDSGRVVGADEIQRPIEGRGRIVLVDGLHGHGKVPGVFSAQQKVQRPRAEGIVHGAVQLVSQQVWPQLAVADLVAGVLPDLTQNQRIGPLCLSRPGNGVDQAVRQLVCHIQPPAGGPQAQPFADHPGFPAEKFLIARVRFLYVGQGIHPPPALITGGVLRRKAVPAVVGAGFRRTGPGLGVISVAVKIDAVVSGVAEYAVQENADSQGLRLPGTAG